MRTATPGNRLLAGASGIVFEVPIAVATGLVRSNPDISYADDKAAEPDASRPRGTAAREAAPKPPAKGKAKAEAEVEPEPET